MPVLVSLLDLVNVEGSRPLWPPPFADLVQQLELSWEDRTLWGVIADWLDEDERSEPELAEAFRWVAKRPDVTFERGKYWPNTAWSFAWEGMPRSVRDQLEYKGDHTTLAGLMTILAHALGKLRNELF